MHRSESRFPTTSNYLCQPPARVDWQKKFLLRVDCGENFPIEPADYKFVNSDTQTDDGSDYWLVYNTNAFKTGETPRVTLIENFASHAAVQEFVDVKPDRTSPEIL